MGSDNMAEDMVEVMRTGLFMERIRREDGRNPTPERALRWASRNGYRAFGMPDGGWLAAGNKADLIMVDTQRAHLVPMLRAVSNFVHNGQARDVQSVMVDGKLADARRQGADDGRARDRRRGAGGREQGVVAPVQEALRHGASRLLAGRAALVFQTSSPVIRGRIEEGEGNLSGRAHCRS